jgi:membrane protease YdiL (CAAX protease family)
LSEQDVPPPIQVETEPHRPEPVERRNPVGWILLWTLLILLIGSAVAATFQPREEAGPRFMEDQLLVRVFGGMRRVLEGLPGGGDATGAWSRQYERRAQELATESEKHPEAAKYYAILMTEAGQRPDPEIVARADVGEEEEASAFVTLYTAEDLSEEQALALSSSFGRDEFTDRMAQIHALEKAGLPARESREALMPIWKAYAALTAFALVGPFVLLSVILWVVFFALRKSGSIRPLGLPMGEISPAMADHLAMRAALILLAFFAGQALLATVLLQGLRVDATVVTLGGALFIVAFVFLQQRLPVFGQTLSLREVGMERQGLGKNLMLGLAAYVMELPLALLMGIIGSRIFFFMPPAEHPAVNVLTESPGLFAILAIVFFGGIVAPFWEEVAFRGMFFRGLARLMKGIWPAALLSSFAFAAIHPQGITTWLALGTVAVVSCILMKYTRSIVPSIVMHAAHNLTLLTLALILF